jgi:hypothetical protein
MVFLNVCVAVLDLPVILSRQFTGFVYFMPGSVQERVGDTEH